MRTEAGAGGSGEPRDVRRELAEAELRGLAGRAFQVYAPTGPQPESSGLGWHRVNGVLVEVTLSHGSWLAAGGPYLAVRTMTTAAVAGQGGAESLQDVIEDERDRIFDHAGINESAGPGPVAESELWIAVDGVPVRSVLRGEGPLWAARLSLGGPDCPLRGAGGLAGEPVTVTVTGRGVDPERVGLRTAAELDPYALGRQRELDAVRARTGPRIHLRDRELPPVQGLEAHRQLVDQSVRQALGIEADLRARRRPRSPRGESRSGGELWERTVRQQMRLAGEDHETADLAVTALVNQLVQLAGRTDWFPGSADAEAAREESIRYTVFGSEVPSVRAQQAWQLEWSRRTQEAAPLPEASQPDASLPDASLPDPGPQGVRERLRRHLDARAAWLELWQEWRAARAGNND